MTNLKSANKPFWSCLIKSVHDWYKINYWLGFPDNIHTTCSHKIPFTFIPCFPLWYLFTILFVCLFVCLFLFSDFPISVANFLYLPIVPWSHFGGLQPITQIFFCTATTLRSSWFWSWCKFEYFFFATIFMGDVLSDLRYFVFCF
jgi:hypothetical protein